MTTERARTAAVTVDVHYAISSFLYAEASILDRSDFAAWLDLLSDDIVYRMPVRVTVASGTRPAVLGEMSHFDENRHSLGKRVQRLQGEYAWTENPASRTRRFVSNVRAFATADPNAFEVVSYLLLFRSRLDDRPAEWISAERQDLLVRSGDGFRIARRDIVVDESVLRTQNLAVFL